MIDVSRNSASQVVRTRQVEGKTSSGQGCQTHRSTQKNTPSITLASVKVSYCKFSVRPGVGVLSPDVFGYEPQKQIGAPYLAVVSTILI